MVMKRTFFVAAVVLAANQVYAQGLAAAAEKAKEIHAAGDGWAVSTNVGRGRGGLVAIEHDMLTADYSLFKKTLAAVADLRFLYGPEPMPVWRAKIAALDAALAVERLKAETQADRRLLERFDSCRKWYSDGSLLWHVPGKETDGNALLEDARGQTDFIGGWRTKAEAR
jgi:hypothetical protein